MLTHAHSLNTGGRIDSSPAVDGNNVVYVGSYDHKLYAVDGYTGALVI